MGLIKRSFTLHGHRTSLALEPEFWAVVDEEAERRSQAVAALIAEIDLTRDPDDSLSSIVRVWALTIVQEKFGPNTG
ncbi:arylsulfate sulfotransferase-related protein [Roseibium sp. TrichSKD4]|uniref:ribbon-helix-helix domain-containing protein n=1 Tax=Roseibium sp. TrichSKD4 TaxID=744980 RepID=UPI0001E568CE|nr:ribbon-helix-helix domain-containing protein [Roseibium sp. TrichSKD4]EFO31017.1 arylsulfate sulfotransferase-related protein [Roseibium sp. TrichSKD4]